MSPKCLHVPWGKLKNLTRLIFRKIYAEISFSAREKANKIYFYEDDINFRASFSSWWRVEGKSIFSDVCCIKNRGQKTFEGMMTLRRGWESQTRTNGGRFFVISTDAFLFSISYVLVRKTQLFHFPSLHTAHTHSNPNDTRKNRKKLL